MRFLTSMHKISPDKLTCHCNQSNYSLILLLLISDTESEVQSRPYSMYCEMPNELSSPSSRSTTSSSSPLSSNKKDSSSNSSLSPLSKIPNPQLLSLSTDGLDTSRLSMCSSHHSSTDEVESDGEIIFL